MQPVKEYNTVNELLSAERHILRASQLVDSDMSKSMIKALNGVRRLRQDIVKQQQKSA